MFHTLENRRWQLGKGILVTGGARSGKSQFVQEMALRLELPVLFVATAEVGDDEMKCRIAEHRKTRPTGWRTLEATAHICRRIEQSIGNAQIVIIDCITLLVSNIVTGSCLPDGQVDMGKVEEKLNTEIEGLIRCIQQAKATFIMVTNEVGLGLVPVNPMGRLYRDLLGKANQRLARQADEVYLMVAGLPVRVK